MKFFVRAFIAAQFWCCVAHAANLTTTNSQGGVDNWTLPIWKINGAGTVMVTVAGNTYQCVFNSRPFGNGTGNTRVRNPASAGVQTFPGDSLTLNTNTEIRAKAVGAILNFPGVGANPGLILNGGVLNAGDDTVFVITGKVQVASQSYICPGDNGGGAVRPLRGFNIKGQLSGSGTMVIFQAGTTVAQQISGNANTFSGRWIVKAGWLLGSGMNSLGTNDITVDPNYVLPLDSSIINVAGPALFEPNYDLNSAGRLTLTNGGVMNLHQNCIFSSVKIEGVSLSAGTHYYPELAANFPNNFATGGSGSLSVQPYGPPPPVAPTIATQPGSVTLPAGSFAQLMATASGDPPPAYQWQKGTNNVYVNATDAGDVSGSMTDTLTFNALAFTHAADYRLTVTNSSGVATSQVATITVLASNVFNPVVTALMPNAGATISTLTQIQVTFDKSVVGVDAEDLLINGLPANSVSGSGSDYVFTFTQPPPGTIPVYWDVDSGISDLSGHLFDPSISWDYALIDSVPPTIFSTAPVGDATVSLLTQAQIVFTEPVTGVGAADLLINEIAATSVTGSGFGPYVFQFAQPVTGTVQFSWPAGHNIRDLWPAANLFAGADWTVMLNAAAASAALTNIVINEFLAANANPGGLTDEDGQLDDWIEIHNRGGTTVNLAGWSLTDQAEQPAQWIFPATEIAPGQFLIVFASGKDRRIPGANLHTSFALNATGDYLGLFNPDFPPRVVHEFAPEFPEQRNDYSFGLDASAGLRYFAIQTPGAPNSSSTLTGVVAEVHFTVGHGFFNQPFNLVLTTTTPGAAILYTTDGSEPSISGGVTNGFIYTAPLQITQTTALRAAGFAPDLLPSRVGSRSYLFIEDIIRQPGDPAGYPTGDVWTPTPGMGQNGARAHYEMAPVIVDDPQYADSVRAGLLSIPTLSIILPIPDLFDPDTGIYTHPQSRGAGWERACSMELIFPDGADGLQLDCGLQIQGGTQREPAKNAKHSFRVNFKGDYGASKLNFGMFPDSPIASFNTLILDSGINYWWHYVGSSSPADQRFRAQCVRDQYASDLMLALGHPGFHGRFYHLYLNGLYWGLHYVHERTDDTFAESYFGGSQTDYDVIRNTTAGTEVITGDLDAWNSALALANPGLTDNAQYVQLQEYVDVENLIDYMIVNHWVGNEDWPHHNWFVLRKRASGEGFKFIIWDAEHVLKSVNVNRTTAESAGSPAQIYNALRNNAEFRLRFADHLQKHFFNGGVFYTDAANPLWDPSHPERNLPASLYLKRINEIDTAIVDESARWGGYTLTTNYTRNDHWLRELNNLLGYTNNPGNTMNYFPQRSANVLNQYKAIGLFPSVNAPVFNAQGGNVPIGFSLTMINPNAGGKIYYTINGTDPRVYGSGAVAFGAQSSTNGSPPVSLRSNVVFKARVLSGGTWSALNEATFSVTSLGVPIRITELMYNPAGGDAYEFVEIQNVGAATVDLSGYSFDGFTFVFPDGTTLPAGGVMILASSANPAAFASRYPGVAVAGNYGGQLSNGGERIALLDANGNTIISVDYQDSGGWPTAADGGGYSLEILSPNGDPDDPANWRASIGANGSPGVASTVSALNSVRLNEVMAENAGTVTNGGIFPDWIELYNAGTNSVSLANWSLSNSGNPRKFVFPTGTNLPAGGYLVVWCDNQTNAPGLHGGFTLGRQGESLFLYGPATNRVDAFSFGLQLVNYSVGRIGPDAAWQLTLATPGANNVAATVGGATNLVINEWLANSAPGAADWIELYNTSSSQPVALSRLYLSTSNQLFQIRSTSFIAPRGFVQLFADEQAGFDHLDFKLTAAGDAVTLYDAGQQIERVSFSSQVEDVSQGRLPNGSSTTVSFPGTASPTASNYVNTYTGPKLNEVMARNLSAVYDLRGNNPDWIEIFNPNASSFSLAGMGLSTDPSESQWTFPSSVSIGANGYLVIWFDPSRPVSTNATTELNTGRALSAGGDGVYLFNGNGQIVDSVAFGFQIADLSIGKNGGAWALRSSPTPGAPNATAMALGNAANLRINEWMANSAGGSDWFEVYNADATPVSLSGLFVTDDPSITGITNFQIGALSFITAHGWVKFEADGDPGDGPNHVGFNSDGNGETIRLYAPNLTLIDAVDFGLQTSGVSQGRLPDGANNIVSFITTPTPDASNYLPLQDVVINEVLTHADPPLEDAIELYNPGSGGVAIGGWFISNSQNDFRKYRIPDGTMLPGGGYKVFYEYRFNSTNAGPFTLNSAHDDSVIVSAADASGNLTGYRAQVSFDAAQNGVSFGRFVTSVGADFVALSSRTFGVDNPSTLAQFRTGTGLPNSGPRIGPVVINEIMYHPVTLSGTNLSENTDDEFIELLNLTSNAVPLYDPLAATNHWKLGGGVDYVFPAGVTLPAGGSAAVVGFDPAANPVTLANFRAKYGVATSIPIFGPYSGKLDNGGESVQLFRPDAPQTAPSPDAGFVPYVLVDFVNYGDVFPWPPGADGTGMSLQRRAPQSYGNEPLNWFACSPNPGTANCSNDSDGDGLPDDWELANELNPNLATGSDGANGDPDGDSFANLQEYLAGTDPQNAQSCLKFTSITRASGTVTLGFVAVAGHSYSIMYRQSLSTGSWQKLADVEAPAMTTPAQVNDPTGGSATRFYRLITPKLP